jgi:CRISPR system Cascade subunit CasB
MMNDDDSGRRTPFWVRYDPNNSAHASVLATLRQGFDRLPGDVPGMWPYYVHLSERGRVTHQLTAEHLALCLFGLHQQGVRTRVHARSENGRAPSFATALNRLRASGRFSEAALDARVSQAATAPDVAALAYHTRGLITMLKTLPASQFSYNLLLRDLEDWQDPARIARVRLRWGIDYMHTETASSTSKEEE